LQTPFLSTTGLNPSGTPAFFDCIVPKALHLRSEPLTVLAPADFADFGAGGRGPVAEMMKMIHHLCAFAGVVQFTKAYPKASPTLKANRQVNGIIAACKALTLSVKQIREHLSHRTC